MAGQFTVRADVTASGPIFDGRAEHALDEWVSSTTKAIADEGVSMLRAFPMDKSGRAHGGFQANLHVLQRGPDAVIPAPTIRGVTWGPWLEGTSSRNQSTGFGGYHLFRKTAAALRKKAPEIAQAELDKVMPQIGGA